MSRGRFISFEGGEACGKSTQIRLLADRLRSDGREVVLLREPGGTPLGEKIRHLLKHDPDGRGMTPEAELLLMNASRAELVRKVIRPALRRGAVVLCDRFSDSTVAYQGAGRGMNPGIVNAVVAAATEGTLPGLTIWLRVDPAEARRRLESRSAADSMLSDRFEEEQAAFFDRVESAYLRLSETDTCRFVAVDGGGEPMEVASRVWARVTSFLVE